MSQGPTFDPQRARELLPWLLNRTLDDSERSAVLDALRGDPSLRRELAETHWAGLLFSRHLPTADVVAYAFGEATETDRALVESHLSSCAECREELSMVRASLAERDAPETTAADVVPFARPADREPRIGVSPAWRALAMAAGLAAVVGLGGWLTTWQQAASQRSALTAQSDRLEAQVDDLVHSLRAAPSPMAADSTASAVAVGLVGGTVRGETGHEVEVAPGSVVDLRFLPEDATPATIYELRLVSLEDAGETLRITPLRTGADGILSVRVGADRIPLGELDAVLYRSEPSTGWLEAERHRLEITRGPTTDG